MKRTKEHAQFFALIEENIKSPNKIKWDRPLTDLITQKPQPTQPTPTSFGVSVAEAFNKAKP